MKNENANKAIPFPVRFLTGALVLTVVVLGALVWFTFDSYQKGTAGQLHNLRIQELRGTIVHLDEVLTMSAHMAATAGDSDWERRYRQFEPQLGASIKEAAELTVHSDKAQAAAQTDAANLKLVEMENQAFTLVRAGDSTRAKAILFSDAYKEQKNIYTEGTNKLILRLDEQLSANQLEKQREAFLAIIAVAVCIVLLFFTWLWVLRSLNSWKTTQSASLEALTKAEEDLSKLNDQLEKRVDDRTRSLQLEIRERKDAEAALQGSRTRLAASESLIEKVWESMIDFVVVCDLDLNITRVNKAALNLNGYEENELIGKSVNILMADRPFSKKGVDALRKNGHAANLDKVNLNKDGTRTPITMSLSVLKDEQGNDLAIVCVGKDITERKRAEDELRESESLLAASQRITHLGSWVIDLSASDDGRPKERWSDEHYRIFGFEPGEVEITDETFFNSIHPDDRELLRVAIERKEPFDIEHRIILADGDERIVHAMAEVVFDVTTGKPLKLLGSVQDITERKQSEQALQESEEHYRFLNDLAEATRPLADPEQIMVVMARMLGEHLGASRCAYADVEDDGDQFTIRHDYVDGCASTVGSYSLSLFGERAVATLKGGQTLVIRNVGTELLPGDGAEMFNAIGIEAIITCPLVKEGGFRAMMSVHQTTPRDWTSREVAIVQDVVERCWATIERMTADVALRENEERFRELLDNANDVIYTLDMAGNFTSLNRAGEAMSGYSRTEAVRMSLTDIIAPESAAAVYERFTLNKQGISQPNFELEIIAKDGRKLTMDVSSRMIIQGGVPVGLQGIGRDITERKRTEAALEESEASFKALFDSASDAIFVTKGGAFQACNPAAEKLFGCTREDMLARRSAADFSPLRQPDGRLSSEKAGELKAAAIKGKPQFFEWTHNRLDGTPFDAEVNLTRVDVGGTTQVQAAVRDITERKRVEEETARLNSEIETHRERLATIIGNVQGVVWETKTKLEEGETSLRFDFISDYIETMLGYSASECVAKPNFWLDIIHPDDRARTEQIVMAIFAGGKDGTVEFRWIARDGHEVWIESRNTIIRDDAGKAVGLRGIAVDISQRKSFEEQLTHQALHDPLTKLGNRVLFRDRVEHAIDRTRRKHSPIAVLFLDLDNFKSVNDSLGHASGDELLVSVTERLQACLRTSDTPARFGGDEFAVLLEDLEHVDQAAFIAERIRNVLCAPFSVAGTEIFIGSSIGIAVTVDGHETPEELLRNADVAMYMSKNNGKDRYTIFENEMHDVLVKRVRLESDMRSAIEKREFEVYYQPIMDLYSERVMGMEALVRWNHPEHGLIPPLDFIPLAEETGLIIPLGKWILEKACLQAREWQTKHRFGHDLSITVNVASRQFLDESLLETVEQALAKSKLPPRSLILEITESTMLANTESTIRKLNELKRLGISFAIDDFGTGYSSLSYLQRFPVDILKIDKSFIDNIASDKEGSAVARAIITMSATLNLKTIAEGIETPGQQTELQNLGCELGQGYHFAKPLRASDMDEFLRNSQTDQTLPIIPIISNGRPLPYEFPK